MNQTNKGSSANQHHWCEVCQLTLASDAEYALHEFSKKHCDNLLRLSKNKPVVTKTKALKNEATAAENEADKYATVTAPGNFAMYGYFVPGEVYPKGEETKEFNIEYDPYLQKFAENPYKEKPEVPVTTASTLAQAALSMPTVNVTSFSRKKKKKIRTCQICNVLLTTVPEYEAHMRSPQHTWKLKMSGMGVSAHFVKASTDLHTTDTISEDSTSNDGSTTESTPTASTASNNSNMPFPSLYCEVCELLLNSEQQYNAHISGKSHQECAQRKADLKAKKEKIQTPAPNQLYCYSCKLSLNNLFQYNEHKNGKKHKAKCRQLMREGIMIPPEERLPSWGTPRIDPNKPTAYPELYEKYVLEPQNKTEPEKNIPEEKPDENVSKKPATETPIFANMLSGMYHCEICNLKFNTASKYELHIKSKEHNQKLSEVHLCALCNMEFKTRHELETHNSSQSHLTRLENLKTEKKTIQDQQKRISVPSIKFFNQKNDNVVEKAEVEKVNEVEMKLAEEIKLPYKCTKCSLEFTFTEEELKEHLNRPDHQVVTEEKSSEEPKKVRKPEETAITATDNLKCNVCDQNFELQSRFEYHLSTEDHAKKILELKNGGKTDDEILFLLYEDKKAVKQDRYGRYSCSVCNVTSTNLVEFNRHLSSIVHKYTEKDYKRKRAVEVRHAVKPDETGKYTCRLCKEGWMTLVEYNQHLHGSDHKNLQRAERAKKVAARRRALMLQQKRLEHRYALSVIKRTSFGYFKRKCEKNPGVRTKISGVATDLNTGAQAPIPNLEPLEPKIDPAKNVNLGVAEKPENKEANKQVKKKKVVKKGKKIIPPLMGKSPNCRNLPPLMPPVNNLPVPPPLLPPRPLRHPNWSPYPPPYHPYRMGPRPPFPPGPGFRPPGWMRPGYR